MSVACVIAVLLLSFARAASICGQEWTYNAIVTVAEETRLDWVYPLLDRSPAVTPAELLGGYRLRGQSYEFYGPVEQEISGALPLVLFVSPQNRPVGWEFWAPTCERHGVMFAGVREAGNGVPEGQRVRAVLDVLDDVRRRHRVDPERTYLAGFSGGAHVASRVAFHLPEYVGGVVSIGDAPGLPAAPGLVERVRQRLSVAIVVGDREPAAAWVEELLGPMLEVRGVRSETVVLPRHGHRMPDASVMEEAFAWLEGGLAARRDLARKYPAATLGEDPSREAWAAALWDEANGRLATPATVDSGLRQLEWIASRWPDLPQAQEARRTLAEFALRNERPWEGARAVEELRLRQVEAAAYERLAARGARALRNQRPALVQRASHLWKRVATESDDRAVVAEAKRHVAGLRDAAAEAAAQPTAIPLAKVRFRMVGEVTLSEGIGHLRQSLSALGYELQIDDAVLEAATADGDPRVELDLPAASFAEVERRFLWPAGLKTQRTKRVIRVVADEKERDR